MGMNETARKEAYFLTLAGARTEKIKALIPRVEANGEEDICDEVFDALYGRKEIKELFEALQDLARAALKHRYRGAFISSSVNHILPAEEQKSLGFKSILTEESVNEKQSS